MNFWTSLIVSLGITCLKTFNYYLLLQYSATLSRSGCSRQIIRSEAVRKTKNNQNQVTILLAFLFFQKKLDSVPIITYTNNTFYKFCTISFVDIIPNKCSFVLTLFNRILTLRNCYVVWNLCQNLVALQILTLHSANTSRYVNCL